MVTIHGAIHGVGFKYYVSKMALIHKMSGYIKNEANGAITLKASGQDKDIDNFLADVEEGNGLSKIACISIEEVPYVAEEGFKAFY